MNISLSEQHIVNYLQNRPVTAKREQLTDQYPFYGSAWRNYKEVVREIAREQGYMRLLEIGGGRDPLFTPQELDEMGIRYTVNDISHDELAKADERYKKQVFDISGVVDKSLHQQYDFIFSRMVFEHVPSAMQAYRNILALLKPGGVAMNFHPTLFATPFLINKAIPDWASSRLLRAFVPNRTPDQIPKFPAYYSLCSSTARTQRRITDIGFSDVFIIPFYAHNYYVKIPPLNRLSIAVARWASQRKLRSFSTFALTFVIK